MFRNPSLFMLVTVACLGQLLVCPVLQADDIFEPSAARSEAANLALKTSLEYAPPKADFVSI